MARRMALWFCIIILLITVGIPARSLAETARTPVLLVHGFDGGPVTTWKTAVSWLEGQGYVQGKTLFTIDLTASPAQNAPMGLFTDSASVAGEIQRIRKETGTAQVDLLGHSRGGLIVRMLASGETSAWVRRAVTLDAPLAGILTAEQSAPLFEALGFDPAFRLKMGIPEDIESGSPALRTIAQRADRFADRFIPALVIGSTWQEGVPSFLADNDGIAPLSSQLAWPGAQTLTFRLGPAPETMQSNLSVDVLFMQSPHVLSHEAPAILKAVTEFLTADTLPAPTRACEPSCQDWALVSTSWAAQEITPFLGERLPYEVDALGQRVFAPDRAMTRAEFVYGLLKALALPERLQAPTFPDVAGHWVLGYAEAARVAKLVTGKEAGQFDPNGMLSRAEAATLVVRAKGLVPAQGAARFTDAHGHWAEGYIETAAANGIVKGDGSGFRPNDPVTMAEGAVILIRSFTH